MNHKKFTLLSILILISHNVDASQIKLFQTAWNTGKTRVQTKIQKALGLNEIKDQITFLCKNMATKDDFIQEINKVDNEPKDINNDSSCPVTKDFKKNSSCNLHIIKSKPTLSHSFNHRKQGWRLQLRTKKANEARFDNL